MRHAARHGPAPDWNLRVRVLYRDAKVLVLDKPAGLAVHAGPRATDHLEAHLHELAFERRDAPRLAHRLDRDTSGCLALGRTPGALKALMALFANARVTKTYWAVTQGAPDADSGTVDLPLRKEVRAGGWRIVPGPGGQPASTLWRVLLRWPGGALVEARPRTGRTHQVRVHLASLAAPIAGDGFYGATAGTLLLHARRLVLPLDEAAPIDATAPLPVSFTEALRRAGVAAPT